VDNYFVALMEVHSMTTSDVPERFTTFLNKHAKSGYLFRYAIRISEGRYLMIFEKAML
jgi:hypothetical protein